LTDVFVFTLLQKPATTAAVEENEDKPDEQIPDMRIAQLAFVIAHGRGALTDAATVVEVIKEKVCDIDLHMYHRLAYSSASCFALSSTYQDGSNAVLTVHHHMVVASFYCFCHRK
jgi:hypothetical protein